MSRWSAREPFDRGHRWLATVAGLVALGLAGLLTYLAIPVEDGDSTRIDAHLSCGSTLLLFFGGVITGTVGVPVLLSGAWRAFVSRTWSSALVGICGLCLLACSVALFVLWQRTSWLCDSD
jgi:hypothetical protein